MNLSFKLGIAYEKASREQNVTEFNILVDEYNAWIRQHFGEDANLFMSKINETIPNETTTLNEAIPNETTTLNEAIPNEIAPEIAPIETTPNDTTPPASQGIRVPFTGKRNPFNPGSDLSKFGKQQVPAF